jgi:hypothetical protein
LPESRIRVKRGLPDLLLLMARRNGG